MPKGRIEVSDYRLVPDAGRPNNIRMQSIPSVEDNVRVKDAVKLIDSYGVKFSHYVHSVRNGLIAVYSFEWDDGRICLRLKNFSIEKLKKIQDATQQKAVNFA